MSLPSWFYSRDRNYQGESEQEQYNVQPHNQWHFTIPAAGITNELEDINKKGFQHGPLGLLSTLVQQSLNGLWFYMDLYKIIIP